MESRNYWKTEFGTDKTVKLNDRLFDLIQFYLTLKTENRTIKMEKTEFGNKLIS